MSWKYNIAFLYPSFVAVILSGVIGSTYKNFDLVRPDYYEAEVRYTERMHAIQNTTDLNEKPKIVQEQDRVRIAFPSGAQIQEGTILLYRPSDANQDQRFPLVLTDAVQVIPTQTLSAGNWRIQLNYRAGGKTYYQEKNLEL